MSRAPSPAPAHAVRARACASVRARNGRRRCVLPPTARCRYDKRVEFEGEKEDNDWDDEIEDFESEEDEIDSLLKGL